MATNPIKLLLWAVMPIALSISGGGGGDNGEADRIRQEEADRALQVAKDRAAIQSLFGNTEYDYTTMPDSIFTTSAGQQMSSSDAQSALERQLESIDASIASGAQADADYEINPTSWQDQRNTVTSDLERLLAQTGDYDAGVLKGQAEDNFATREGTLGGIYNDILAQRMDELDTQYGRKASDTKAMIAGRGLSGSSVGQSILDRLGGLYDKTEVDFEQDAGSAIDRIRTADAATRDQLVGNINDIGDYSTAASSAASQLTSNIDTTRNEAMAADLSNLFKGMDELYGQSQYVDAYNRGSAYGSSNNIVTPGSTRSSAYSGNIIG